MLFRYLCISLFEISRSQRSGRILDYDFGKATDSTFMDRLIDWEALVRQ